MPNEKFDSAVDYVKRWKDHLMFCDHCSEIFKRFGPFDPKKIIKQGDLCPNGDNLFHSAVNSEFIKNLPKRYDTTVKVIQHNTSQSAEVAHETFQAQCSCGWTSDHYINSTDGAFADMEKHKLTHEIKPE